MFANELETGMDTVYGIVAEIVTVRDDEVVINFVANPDEYDPLDYDSFEQYIFELEEKVYIYSWSEKDR